jgi:hypothetical protein
MENRVVTAPAAFADRPSLFLAGGISNCPNWQLEMIDLLQPLPTEWLVLNPRRADFPVAEWNNNAEAQIEWEHHALVSSRCILFWFPKQTVCPITLYELGTWSRSDKTLFVGADPEYPRRKDIEVQTRLARPDVSTAASTIEQLVLSHLGVRS